MAQSAKLRISQVEKSFPGVKALDKIDLVVKKGSVHVLCGENGAGKSTLMKIINGIYQPDAGQIFLDEKPVKIHNPQQAKAMGISMIFQEMNYVPEMTVEESLFMDDLPVTKLGKVDWRKIRRDTVELLKEEDLNYPPGKQLKYLSVSDIQMLDITKAVSRKSDIIIMDEPTSSITQKEVEKLFERIRLLKSRGVSVIYISHKLDEIFRIADEITVFRDGTVAGTGPKDEWDIEKVITKMVGRKLDSHFPKEDAVIGDKVLEVTGLTSTGLFHDISFNLRRGEILGFSGLMGAGRTEIMRALFGLDPKNEGEIKIRGKTVANDRVTDSIRNGLAMLSEDRRRYGIIPVRSVKENATLGTLRDYIYHGFLHGRKERNAVSEMFDKLSVKTPSLDTRIEALSGGNQQKVVLSKWLLLSPDILILDEPTRGIDVGAKYEIYKLMNQLTKQGKGIIMVSSDLPELIGMCDRIYVISKGRITGELSSEDFTQEEIMRFSIA